MTPTLSISFRRIRATSRAIYFDVYGYADESYLTKDVGPWVAIDVRFGIKDGLPLLTNIQDFIGSKQPSNIVSRYARGKYLNSAAVGDQGSNPPFSNNRDYKLTFLRLKGQKDLPPLPIKLSSVRLPFIETLKTPFIPEFLFHNQTDKFGSSWTHRATDDSGIIPKYPIEVK